jgi:hypothetical protein
MWSHIYKKYKQDRAKPLVEDNETHTEIKAMDMSSYISKQSTAAASAFTSGKKKHRIKTPAKESQRLTSKCGSPLKLMMSPSSSDSGM